MHMPPVQSCLLLACLASVDGLSLGRASHSRRPAAPIGQPAAPGAENGSSAEPGHSFAATVWDGLDDGGAASETGRDGQGLNTSDGKVFVILGPQDSGSNLLTQLITYNFPGLVPSHRPGGEMWKHVINSADMIPDVVSLNLRRRNQTLEETSVVMIVRSPLSQIVSWKRVCYDMDSCVLRPYWRMNETCEAGLGGRGFSMGGHSLQRFGSTVDVYNEYVRQYQRIVAGGRFKNARIFTYEDVVYSTEEVVKVLAQMFDRRVPDKPHLQDTSAKGDEGIGRMQAREKIEQRLYLKKISTEEQAVMCQGLDYDLAETMVEGSYFALGDPKRKAHSYDCRQAS